MLNHEDYTANLRDVVIRHLHGYDVRSVAVLGQGLDHIAWLVNDEFVVRRAKAPVPEVIRREAAILDVAGRYSTLAVPRVAFADPDAGILAYHVLPGQPLMDLPDANAEVVAAQLGTFLGSIHAIPLSEIDHIVERDDDSLADWLEEARETYPMIVSHLPPGARQKIDVFLSSQPPPESAIRTFCHNDLGAEHILVDLGTMRVTGIIDWADAAITDPMHDLAMILRDLGPGALERALVSYGRTLTPGDRDRILFHARCKLIEDIAFGLETGTTRYVDAALAHLPWTFDDHASGSARWKKRI